MVEDDKLIVEAAEKIISRFADPRAINRAKDKAWQAALWKALVESSLTAAWAAEEYGGGGASLQAGFELLRSAGRFALAAPLAETLLASWLLSQARIKVPEGGRLGIAPADPRDRISVGAGGKLQGRARHVLFAQECDYFAVLAEGSSGACVALVPGKAITIEPSPSLSRDPAGTVVFDGAAPTAIAPVALDRDSVMLMGCVARSMQIAGALEAILELTTQYANERVAFERKISKFQAIQHTIAALAGEAAAAAVAASSGADALAAAGGPANADDALFLEAASAKIRCAEAAAVAAKIAHQVHGAIGMTEEHVLHRFTLRAMMWRDDFGNEAYWAVRLGERVAASGANALWPLLASR